MSDTGSELASWVGAIGAVGTVVVAVFLWRADRRHERREIARNDRERVQRIVIALKAEINSAMTVAKRQRFSVGRTLAALNEALKEGVDVGASETLPADSMTIVDTIVFRALAADIGRLPIEIITNTTEFYSLARDLERHALMGDAITVFRNRAELLPRLLMHGAITLRIFDRFLAADCAPGTDLKLAKEELLALAKEVEYPLEEIARGQGITV